MENKTLSAKINELFVRELSKNASNTELSDEEKEAKRVMLSELFREVQSIVSEHQEKVQNTSKALFEIVNDIHKLGL